MEAVKEYYRTYEASGEFVELHHVLTDTILGFHPSQVFEFGCGVGKNLLALLRQSDKVNEAVGIDISPKNIEKAVDNGMKKGHVLVGDESFLNGFSFQRFDVSFTCSVLDHIPEIEKIVNNLKRISKKAVILAETNDIPGKYYFPHDYESLGFRKLNYKYASPQDKSTYFIWIYSKITE